MDQVAVVVFDEEKQAERGFHALRELEREKKLTSYADAVVTRTTDGNELRCRSLRTGLAGAQMGLLMGSLVGLLRGPLGVAFGAGVGMLLGVPLDLIFRRIIKRELLNEVSPLLPPGGAAVVTDIGEESPLPLDTRMEALGGKVYRRRRVRVQDANGQRMSAGRM